MAARYIIFFVALQLLYSCSSSTKTTRQFDISPALFDATRYVLTDRRTGESYTVPEGGEHIDIESLQSCGEFLFDKHRVYAFYNISDGVLVLERTEIDRKSFRVFGNTMYARDSSHIFDSRNGIIEGADAETFEVVYLQHGETPQPHGRDKNHYYFWHYIVEDTTGFSNLIKKM